MMKKIHSLRGLAFALFLSAQTFYGQTTLPGTVELELGTLAGGAAIGGGNGGTENVVNGLRNGRSATNSVNVASEGFYDFEFTYLNSAAGTAGITLNVVSPASTLFSSTTLLPIAGDFVTYATATKERVFLAAGTYDIELINPTGYGINIDNYIVTESPDLPAVVTALPGTVEVETGTLAGGASTGGKGGGGTVVSGLYGATRSVSNSVTVATAGIYDFEFHYKTGGGSGSAGVVLSIDNPATNLFGGVFFVQGGSYATYLTASKLGVYLPAGTYDVKLTNSTGNGINIDKYVVTTSATGRAKFGSTINITDANGSGNLIEVENYDVGGEGVSFRDTSLGNSNIEFVSPAIAYRSDNIDVGDGGTGIIVGNTAAEEWMEYTVTVANEGSYKLAVSWAAGADTGFDNYGQITAGLYNSAGAVLTELINDANSLKTSNTGDWTTYATTTSVAFDLSAGADQILRLKLGSGGVNIDNIVFVYQGALGIEDINSQEKVVTYPNPSTDGQFNLARDTSWEVYSLIGTKLLEGQGKSVDLTSYDKGIYLLKTENGGSVKLLYN